MGERLSGDGVPGRRRVHPDDAVSGPWDRRDDTALETVLAAVLRGGDLAPEAEQRAVAAFRAARGGGAHRARTRRRDDWRLPAERRTGRPVKTTFAAVFASLTLGGVAVAAIGSAGSSTGGGGADRKTAHPSVSAPARPGGETSSASSGGAGPTDGSAAAQDTEAHCRAYEQVKDRGEALDATAWQQLVAAAGGEGKVAAYCAAQLARATTSPSRSGDTGKPGEGAADAGTGTAGNTGTSGNTGMSGNTGTSGNGNPGNDANDADGADNGAGNGQASGGKGQ
ncbi:hypothetical protein [Streptomyces ureilyticus]|uniref:Uncharacterized protein n=1 Tax=Streptomyces ureilyticus TaxID=1775131 RepID=A0ABX0DKP3_9ACTN|nr:hypothetical protein [Streptomyces ureilyticus]NGO42000.1 hypothetical protein [Streptomyces ureilyticus]